MKLFNNRYLQAGLVGLALAGNSGAAILSDDFSGTPGASLGGSALDIGGSWSDVGMGGNFIFANGGGIVPENNAESSICTTFNAGSYAGSLTNGFTVSATFAANGYTGLSFTLGLAETMNKGNWVNLVANDVIRFTYYVGGANTGRFKWAIYDESVLLNNDFPTRAGTQTINSNDVIRLSITCYPATGLIIGVATNLTGGYPLSRSCIAVNTPGLTNTLYAGFGITAMTVTNAADPAKITTFSVTSEGVPVSRPLSLGVPPTMTFSSFDAGSYAFTNMADEVAKHEPIDFIHGGVVPDVRAAYPQKILTFQDAWGGSMSLDRGAAYPGHWLMKPGTKLTADCAATTNDTVLYVQDYTRIASSQNEVNGIANTIESELLLYALGGDGHPDWSRAEHVKMIAVNTSTGGITVQRAQNNSTPLAFTHGQAVLARHDMFWTSQWELNFSLQCPRGGPFNMTAAEWFALQMAREVYNSDADGIEFDVAMWQKDSPEARHIMDCDNDLVADYGYIGGVNSYGLGGQVFQKRLRELLGPNKIIQMDGNNSNTGQRGWQYVNGVQMECFPQSNQYDRYSEAFLHLRLWANNVQTAPAISYPFVKCPTTTFGNCYDTDGSNLDWCFRVGFAAGLLTGMPTPFNSITDINFDPANPDNNNPNMVLFRGLFPWDEYMGGTNDLNNWKWLGAPLGDALQITNDLSGSNLLASSQWAWKTETGFSSSCSISNGEYAATITAIPANTPQYYSANYPGSQVPKTLWFGTRLDITNGAPTLVTNQEYTVEFEAKGNDSWTVNGQTFDKVPRSLMIHGVANYGYNNPASVFLGTNWTAYRLSMIADSVAPPALVFGFSEQIGNASIRNIQLYQGGAERWVREFTNGIVLLNMTKQAWTYAMPTAYRHFNGTQHPEINDGQRVPPTVVVPSWDALFLVKASGTNILVAADTTSSFTPGGLLLGANDSLSGWGVLTGNVVAVSGAMIYPGTLGTPTGTLSFSNNLTLNGQTLTFDLGSNPAGTNNDRIVVAGSVTNNGNTTISLNYLYGYLGAGTYTLMTYASRQGGIFALDAAYANVTLNIGATSLTLTVGAGGAVSSDPLVWRGGSATNAWDIATTTNWLFNGQAALYYDGAAVLFDSTATSPAVNLAVTVSPASVTVNSSSNYALQGSGRITSGGSLTKYGTGTLTISNSAANTFASGTVIKAGKVVALNNNSLGVGGAVTLGDTSGNTSASLEFKNAFYSTAITVANGSTGTLTFGVNSGSPQLNAGSLVLNNTTTPLTIAHTAGSMLIGGAISGPGSLAVAGTLVLSGSNTFTGGVTLNSATLGINRSNALGTGVFTINGDTMDSSATAAITNANNNAMVWNGSFTFTGTTNLHLGNGAVDLGTGSRTVTVSANTLTVGGAITNTGGLTKTGSGMLVLAGPSGYTGPTTNSGGLLLVNGSLGTGAVVVKTNATLGGNGVLRGPLTVEVGGAVQPGSGGTNIATLTVSNTVNLSGKVLLLLNRTNAPNASKLATSSILTLGGALIVTNVGPALQANDTFALLSAGSINSAFSSKNLPPLTAGLTWNTGQLVTNGMITVVGPAATNQPVFLPPFLSGTNLVLSGTNGTAGNQYLVLSTTNVTLLRTNWTVLATNTFGPGGQFAFTNAINPAEPARFFILRLR